MRRRLLFDVFLCALLCAPLVFLLSASAGVAEGIPPQDKGLPLGKERQAPLPVPTLNGWYKLAGIQGKVPYAGMVLLRQIEDTYLVLFTLEGGSQTRGVGLPVGDRLVVGWGAGGSLGVTVYEIQPGGVLAGRWATMPTDGKQHTETLTYSHKLAPPPPDVEP